MNDLVAALRADPLDEGAALAAARDFNEVQSKLLESMVHSISRFRRSLSQEQIEQLTTARPQ